MNAPYFGILHRGLNGDLSSGRIDASEYRGPDVEFFERVYESTIVPRVMRASGKQRRFGQQGNFKDSVASYYSSARETKLHIDGYCHVLGLWMEMSEVKVAHVVPRSLSAKDLGFLFGGETDIWHPKNGLLVHHRIKQAMDQGLLVLVPMLQAAGRWLCILVDKTKADNPALGTKMHSQNVIKFGGLDRKEVTFVNDNRPARRFMYFRFIIIYPNAKVNGNVVFTDLVDKRHLLWPSPRPYLHRSTLVSFARNISGFELPPAIAENDTFENETDMSDEVAGTMLANEFVISARVMREAVVESVNGLNGENVS